MIPSPFLNHCRGYRNCCRGYRNYYRHNYRHHQPSYTVSVIITVTITAPVTIATGSALVLGLRRATRRRDGAVLRDGERARRTLAKLLGVKQVSGRFAKLPDVLQVTGSLASYRTSCRAYSKILAVYYGGP